MMTEKQANVRAAILADTLGPGWEPRVWNKMGWRYAAYKGCTHISPFYYRGERRGYTRFFNSKSGQVLSDPLIDDPREALFDAIRKITEKMLVLSQDFKELVCDGRKTNA